MQPTDEILANSDRALRVSVLIPVLNDAEALARLLERLQKSTARLSESAMAGSGTGRCGIEILVIDGGSIDASVAVAGHAPHVHAVLQSAAGRGVQLAAGVAGARGRWLWLLHADSDPAPSCLGYLLSLSDRPAWGRFDVALAGGALLALVAGMMNLRSRLTGICTGDQGIFVHHAMLEAAGGMPAQPLMEDIELSRRLKRMARPLCRPERILTSSRRWRRGGVVRTILGMWRFRLRYWLGADPERLAREYYR